MLCIYCCLLCMGQWMCQCMLGHQDLPRLNVIGYWKILFDVSYWYAYYDILLFFELQNRKFYARSNQIEPYEMLEACMTQKSHNCNLWIAYIHLFDTFPKICFWRMVDFLASGYYSVSCYFSIIHYFSLYRVRCCSILYHYHYVLCCHIIVWRDDNEDDMCVFSSYNKGVVIHFQRNRICPIYKSS